MLRLGWSDREEPDRVLFWRLAWMARLVQVPCAWCYAVGLGWELPPVQSLLIAAGILLFLFRTGLFSRRTNARLAQFTIKLAIAILIAALLRPSAAEEVQ